MLSLLTTLALLLLQANGSIEGIVIRAGSGEPVPRAKVTLSHTGNPITATAGADGKFVFSNLRPGPYILSATAPGFVVTEQVSPVVLDPSTPVTGVRVAMLQTGSISGRIFDRNREPASRAQVQAQRIIYREGVAELTVVQAVLTNDLGEYRLFWLPPGTYYVCATLTDPHLPALPILISPSTIYAGRTQTARGMLTYPGAPTGSLVMSRSNGGVSVEEAFAPIYYPATRDRQTASRISVQPGSSVGGVEIIATPSRVFRIRGTVIDEASGSIVRANSVTIVPKTASTETADSLLATATGNGYEFSGIAPGSYLVTANYVQQPTGPGAVLAMVGRTPVEVGDANLENVAIVVRRPVPISGKMIVQGLPNLPRPGINERPGLAQVLLRSEDQSGAQITAPVNAEGNFAFLVPFPDAYKVFVRNFAGFSGYVKSIRFGPDDGLLDRIHINGPAPNTIDVVIGTNPGKLSGSVLNDRREPAQDTSVVIVPEPRFRGRFDLFMVAKTDSTGKFSIEGITPGNYKIFAWEDVDFGTWFDPEFMRIQETRGMPLSVVEGSSDNLELRILSSR